MDEKLPKTWDASEELVTSGDDLDDELMKKLIDKHRWSLIFDYMKKKPEQRIEQVLLAINFDFMKPENYDQYVMNLQAIKELVSKEKVGVIDETIRESIALLLKSFMIGKK